MPEPTVKPAAVVILYRKDLALRYRCDLRTIDRDHAQGVLPPGRYRRGKNKPFWFLHEIEATEKFRPRLKRRLERDTKPAPAIPQFTFKF